MAINFSYFELALTSYLYENFPDKAEDKTFISNRATLASEAYSQAIKDGYSHQGAGEKAQTVLFEGLYFSPYSTIIEVLCNEFDDQVPEALLSSFGKILLEKTRKLFAKYELSDDFAYTPQYESLYTELTGFILTTLERNGLQ